MTAEKVILISYFPFLDNAGGTFTPGSEAAKSALKALRKLDTVVIKGVAWLGEEQSGIATSPCFVVDNAGKLEEHLLWWSENNPKDWFQLIWDKDDSGYTIAVIPTITKNRLNINATRTYFFSYFFTTKGAPYKGTDFALPRAGEAKIFFCDEVNSDSINRDGILIPCYEKESAPEVYKEIFRELDSKP